MRIPRRPLAPVPTALLAACALAVSGCGGDPKPAPETLVRDKVEELGRATAAKDYGALCERILAPQLVEQLTSIGLPCRVALQRGLGDVRQPRLQVGQVRVTGDTANAEIATSAAGQPPSRDTVQLVRTKDGWRVSALAGGGEGPAPSPSPTPTATPER